MPKQKLRKIVCSEAKKACLAMQVWGQSPVLKTKTFDALCNQVHSERVRKGKKYHQNDQTTQPDL